MSNQPSQRVRRIASPSAKHGPMKATLTFGLMQGSPTRASNGRKNSPSSSPTPQRTTDGHKLKSKRSSDNRTSPERVSPNSPGFKGIERLHLSPNPMIKRTGSFDTITNSYLNVQWPRDTLLIPIPQTNSGASLSSDKATQTPTEWDDLAGDLKQKHKRSASLGNGDTLKEVSGTAVETGAPIKIVMIKAHFTKRKTGQSLNAENKRNSPIHGNHLAIQTKAVNIPAHIPKQHIRIRGSVEGLNQEIERLVLKNTPGQEQEERVATQDPTPDGHRAPVIELLSSSTTRTIDTQTPSSLAEEVNLKPPQEVEQTSSGSSSRSQSESPSSYPIIPGQMDNSRPSSRSDSNEPALKIEKIFVEYENESDSPDPKYACPFRREPPDGAEKINVEERRPVPPVKEPLLYCPMKEPNSRLRIPSDDSAFCPLFKPYMNQPSEMALKATLKETVDV